MMMGGKVPKNLRPNVGYCKREMRNWRCSPTSVPVDSRVWQRHLVLLLDLMSIAAVSKCSRAWRQLLSGDATWRALRQRDQQPFKHQDAELIRTGFLSHSLPPGRYRQLPWGGLQV